MPALMIQGCGSDVGKSVLVAGLCRAFANRGLNVRPFKPQNMSNNAAVTPPDDDGLCGEIGRAQALQALACRVPSHVDMNPVLLKPQSDTGSQLVIRGQVKGNWSASGYQGRKADLLPVVIESFERLQSQTDLVIVEGAGSPAEVNLRAGDIANMGFARAADVPVILVGDIDRGHVIASLVGTKSVLDDEDNALIKGFIINKFRGDPNLFAEGRRYISNLTGWADMGMVPWLRQTEYLPAEDAVALRHATSKGTGRIRVGIPVLPHISNFDDFDPLKHEADIELIWVRSGEVFPADLDLIILPGSKATIADLMHLRAQGWDIDIRAHARRGGRVLGICGGYQMLGESIHDPHEMEGGPVDIEGLGLLDVVTTMESRKVLRSVQGSIVQSGIDQGGVDFHGYEMHIGVTTGPDTNRPVARIQDRPHGATSPDGRVSGLYIHGLFASAGARAALLGDMGAAVSSVDHFERVDKALNSIASQLEASLNIPLLAEISGVKL